jgi:hypothetical protein
VSGTWANVRAVRIDRTAAVPWRSLSERSAVVLRRLRRAVRPTPVLTLEKTPDGVPKHGFFTEPVRVAALEVLEPEPTGDGRHRVTFRVEVRDAEGRRCSELAVDARVGGPERSRDVQAVTDLFGRVRIRMTGPPGTYRIEIIDVAARGLAWDRDAGPRTTETSVPG